MNIVLPWRSLEDFSNKKMMTPMILLQIVNARLVFPTFTSMESRAKLVRQVETVTMDVQENQVFPGQTEKLAGLEKRDQLVLLVHKVTVAKLGDMENQEHKDHAVLKENVEKLDPKVHPAIEDAMK